MMHPTLDLFLAALLVGFGAGLGWAVATWLFGLITSLVNR